ncbi:MAG: ParM/StbA family protein [Kouleothrix sp.]|nr:ParM/StbA family protein [Kouleothrix sp.]
MASLAGHGPNIGHTWVKYVIIGSDGRELPPVCFPSVIASAGRQVAGTLVNAPVAMVAGQGRFWTGLDAQLSGNQISIMSQDRLSDPCYLPALFAGALGRMGHLNGNARGVFVSGLPANQALDATLCQALAARLRAAAAADQIAKLKIIGEPLGLAYGYILDNNGQLIRPELASARLGIVDLGGRTVDLAELLRLALVDGSYRTFDLGAARPLGELATQLSARADRDLTVLDADLAVRDRSLKIGKTVTPLPRGWDRPFVANGEAVVRRIDSVWGRGTQFDAILVGGGGAELEPVAAQITRAYPNAIIVDRPQLAIATGYARLARRIAASLR